MIIDINRLNYHQPVDNHFININYYVSEKTPIFKIPLLQRLANFLFDKLIDKTLTNSTKLLLEISGLPNFIDTLEKIEGERVINLLTKVLRYTETMNKVLLKYPHGHRINELCHIFKLISEETEKVIEKVEDKIYEDSYLKLSLASMEDDWNNPENDIWDTY